MAGLGKAKSRSHVMPSQSRSPGALEPRIWNLGTVYCFAACVTEAYLVVAQYTSHNEFLDDQVLILMAANFDPQVDMMFMNNPVITSGAELWMRH